MPNGISSHIWFGGSGGCGFRSGPLRKQRIGGHLSRILCGSNKTPIGILCVLPFMQRQLMTSAEAGLEGKSQNERDSFQGTLEECRRLLLRVFEGISHTLKGRSTRCGFHTAAGISHHVYLLGNSDFFYAISQDFAPIFFGVRFLTKPHCPFPQPSFLFIFVCQSLLHTRSCM